MLLGLPLGLRGCALRNCTQLAIYIILSAGIALGQLVFEVCVPAVVDRHASEFQSAQVWPQVWPMVDRASAGALRFPSGFARVPRLLAAQETGRESPGYGVETGGVFSLSACNPGSDWAFRPPAAVLGSRHRRSFDVGLCWWRCTDAQAVAVLRGRSRSPARGPPPGSGDEDEALPDRLRLRRPDDSDVLATAP
jgi:hypothetical protein